LVYHGVRHDHNYVSQSCIVDLLEKIFNETVIRQNISSGKLKKRDLAVNVLEVVEQLRESAEHIVGALRDALKQNNIDI
ncbi:unnamed protein product, partial [Rotaria sp. Silwood1]